MAMILAGGVGARLKPFTMTIPKPLLPIGDVPIIEVVISQLVAAGVDRIVLALGHMPHLFAAVIGDGSSLGARIDYFEEKTPLGTAGALRCLQALDPPGEFLLMNGDILTTLDSGALFERHHARNADITIALSHRQVPVEYGVIETDADDDLTAYKEKPVIEYDVSMGINIVSRRCLDLIPADRRFDVPDLVLAAKATGLRVSTLRTTCYWQDIGRFEDYQQASLDFTEDPGRFLPRTTETGPVR